MFCVLNLYFYENINIIRENLQQIYRIYNVLKGCLKDVNVTSKQNTKKQKKEERKHLRIVSANKLKNSKDKRM